MQEYKIQQGHTSLIWALKIIFKADTCFFFYLMFVNPWLSVKYFITNLAGNWFKMSLPVKISTVKLKRITIRIDIFSKKDIFEEIFPNEV